MQGPKSLVRFGLSEPPEHPGVQKSQTLWLKVTLSYTLWRKDTLSHTLALKVIPAL